jgi:hypothetical protein
MLDACFVSLLMRLAALAHLHPCSACLRLISPACHAAKKDGDQLFECFDAQDLNVRLKDLMDGLSVKVRALAVRTEAWHATVLTRVGGVVEG